MHSPLKNRNTLASTYSDFVSPTTRPREFGILITSIISQHFALEEIIYIHTVNLVSSATSTHNVEQSQNIGRYKYRDLVSPSTRPREFGLSIKSIMWLLLTSHQTVQPQSFLEPGRTRDFLSFRQMRKWPEVSESYLLFCSWKLYRHENKIQTHKGLKGMLN